MKPITLNIIGQFTDGYIYLGRLFLIELDGTVSSVSMDELVEQARLNNMFSVLKVAFLRNDWLDNQQGKNFLQIPGQLKSFKAAWDRLANSELAVDSRALNLVKHFDIPDTPIFDIRAYGLRLYFGNRNGLYESQLITKQDEFENIRKPLKVFDARTTYISAKSGELMISSNSDGLFRGKVGIASNKSTVNESPVSSRSIRTGWASYDVLNYESQNSFVYYVNETDKAKGNPRVSYSNNDENSDKKEIKNFGVEMYSQEDLLNAQLKDAEIKYSFNSSNSYFLLTSKNILYRSAIVKKMDGNHHKVPVVKRYFDEILKFKGKTKIISTAFIPSGVVVETLSSVILTSTVSNPLVLHNYPVYTIKTLLTSRRFKNIVLVFHKFGLSIHSLFPINL